MKTTVAVGGSLPQSVSLKNTSISNLGQSTIWELIIGSYRCGFSPATTFTSNCWSCSPKNGSVFDSPAGTSGKLPASIPSLVTVTSAATSDFVLSTVISNFAFGLSNPLYEHNGSIVISGSNTPGSTSPVTTPASALCSSRPSTSVKGLEVPNVPPSGSTSESFSDFVTLVSFFVV